MDSDIVGMAIRGGTIYYCAWKEVDSTIISPNF
jgi:hypothetical protein